MCDNDSAKLFHGTLPFELPAPTTATAAGDASKPSFFSSLFSASASSSSASASASAASAAANWRKPTCVLKDDTPSRPGYDSASRNEFVDDAVVLAAKVKILAQLIRSARHFVVYSGAGLSTASGIGDYGSAKSSTALKPQEDKPAQQLQSPLLAHPTYAHRALVALYRGGLLHFWVQQNHDGLPQKAGFPQQLINEIHGAWFDPSNPVVPMKGDLRGDLFEEMLHWENQADLVLAVGTTMSGMNADRVFISAAERYQRKRVGLGGVIINLQQTNRDPLCALRIFEKLDNVFSLLLKELQIENLLPPAYAPPLLPRLLEDKPSAVLDTDVFVLAGGMYGEDGKLVEQPTEDRRCMIWDLSEGAEVKIVAGPYKDHQGEVVGKTRDGYYSVRIVHPHLNQTTGKTMMMPKTWALGSWWVDVCAAGKKDLPVVNIGKSLRYVAATA